MGVSVFPSLVRFLYGTITSFSPWLGALRRGKNISNRPVKGQAQEVLSAEAECLFLVPHSITLGT